MEMLLQTGRVDVNAVIDEWKWLSFVDLSKAAELANRRDSRGFACA